MENKFFLFSVDMEDIRTRFPGGTKYKERVPEMTERILTFLNKYSFKATFFVVGDVAEAYPNLIRSIAGEKHEIACHSYSHIPLDRLSEEDFRKDISKNKESLVKLGITNIKGFRAPVFSITEKTKWAYKILADLGFTYSSSVLPASNPLYGWKDHSESIVINENIVELPITLTPYPVFKVPFAGGVYFRAMPLFLIKYFFRKTSKNDRPVIGYFHPYDIDAEQEKFMSPGIHNSRIFNFLMYYNRKDVFNRLEAVIGSGYEIMTYEKFIEEFPPTK